VAAPEVPRVDHRADQGLEPPGGFEGFFLREYRGVVELAYALSGSRAGAQEAFLRATVTGTGSVATGARAHGSGGSRSTRPPRPSGGG
jgi:hypothetical protein